MLVESTFGVLGAEIEFDGFNYRKFGFILAGGQLRDTKITLQLF